MTRAISAASYWPSASIVTITCAPRARASQYPSAQRRTLTAVDGDVADERPGGDRLLRRAVLRAVDDDDRLGGEAGRLSRDLADRPPATVGSSL